MEGVVRPRRVQGWLLYKRPHPWDAATQPGSQQGGSIL